MAGRSLELGLGGGELILGVVEAVLEIGDLLEHGIDLTCQKLEEIIDLFGVVTLLCGGEGLLLDVLWCDCHVFPFRFSARPFMQKTATTRLNIEYKANRALHQPQGDDCNYGREIDTAERGDVAPKHRKIGLDERSQRLADVSDGLIHMRDP